MLNSEIDQVQTALGYLEACASLHANASDDPVMKAQIQAQTDRVRKALVAAQAEARELRDELSRMRSPRTEADLSQLQHDLGAALISALLSPEKLPKDEWYDSARFCRDAICRALDLVEEQLELLGVPLHSADPDDWPESRIDVIGQNGNDGDHYADAERESLPPPLIDEEDYDEPFETAAGARVEADWDLARELGKERSDG